MKIPMHDDELLLSVCECVCCLADGGHNTLSHPSPAQRSSENMTVVEVLRLRQARPSSTQASRRNRKLH